MSEISSVEHVIVTPCRDHREIFSLFDSIVAQTVLPVQWVIVLHNLTDLDHVKISNHAKQFDWITIIRVEDNSTRKRGAQIARLVNIGISEIDHNWTYFSKIDADMILQSEYFEKIFRKFSENEKLGIASGVCHLVENDVKYIEKVSKNHTRGGLKTYRKQCFVDIRGIREVDGWDGVDNIAAQINGWETSNFNDIPALHSRRTGSYNGLINGCFEAGKFAYAMRYSFPFLVARSFHRMLRKPFFIGGVSMFFGYLKAALRRTPQSLSDQEKKYLRKLQRRRLIAIGADFKKR